MKTVNDLEKFEEATIKKIHALGDLKTRLMTLGFHKGAHIVVQERSAGKQTVQVNVENMRLALRMNEAKEIEVYEND